MDCEMPSVSDTDVLVEVAHVGICGSDMHIFEDPYYAVKDIKLPVVLGHECAGRVVEVGKKVEGIVPGDRVALEPGVPCQTCEFCMSGRYNLCPDVRFLGARPWLNGAFSRYVSHPARWTFKLPDAMDTVEGALLEPLVVGMHSVNRANPGTGQAVLILGAGCIGLMTLEACLARGITNVTISDLYENRLNMAGTIGARHTVNSSKEDIVTRTAQITGNKGYDSGPGETRGKNCNGRECVRGNSIQFFQNKFKGGGHTGSIPLSEPVSGSHRALRRGAGGTKEDSDQLF